MRVRFLKSQQKDQNRTTVFFSELRKCRKSEIELNKERYIWGEPEYKIYPSSLLLSMCPVEFVENLHKWSGIADLGAIYKVKRGTAVHDEYQEDFRKLSSALYAKPTNIKLDRIQKKLEDKWPEVPFQDLEWSGLSGSADLVLDWNGPCPVEIKSTSSRWDTPEQRAKLPYDNHILQIGIYMYMFNMLGYYPSLIERGVIAYHNLLIPAGDVAGEMEFIVHLKKTGAIKKYPDETLEELVEDLLANIADVRGQYIEGKPLTCTYKKCSKHGPKPPRKSRKKAEASGGPETPHV